MRKTFIILSIVFLLFAIIFTIAPLQKFGIIISIIALIFGLLAYKKSDLNQTNVPKFIAMIAVATLFSATYIVLFTENEKVEIDKQFEQQKIQSENDAKNTLEAEGL